MSCLKMTPAIKELAKSFPKETPESVKNLVSLWQENTNKSIEKYPSAGELNEFIKKIRKAVPSKVDTKFSTSGNNSYPSRTRENANWSDITIALAQDFNTAGEKLTKNAAKNKYVSSILSTESNNASEIAENLYNQIKSKGKVDNLKINIAGNGIYSMSQNQAYYNDLVTQILEELQNKGVTIAEIRSGGQTGIDEAGIIAAQRLGIPSEVHSTANFMFRDKSGKDISDEQAFKSRFSFSTPSRQEERLGDAFDTPQISSLEEQQRVDLEFDPKTRRDRVTLISNLFSNEIEKALQEKADELNKQIAEAPEGRKLQLEDELQSLDRLGIIRELTPAGIFQRVQTIFSNYTGDTEDNRTQIELNTINQKKAAAKYSDEEKLKIATERASYKNIAYKKIIDNFKSLAEEASTMLVATEGIMVDPNYIAPDADDFSREEAFKDGWMTHYREVSSYASLSQAVRKIIREVPRLDYRGKYEKDDLGFPRYLDADYVHATLVDKLRNMITAEDMLPLLNDLGKSKPWVRQVVKRITSQDSDTPAALMEKEQLFSQFYQDFRKDFIPYWIQKKKIMPDGSIKIQTIAVNSPEGVYYLLDAWRDNYENGIKLDDDSVYDKKGDIVKANAEKGLAIIEDLNNQFNNLDSDTRLKLLDKEEVWNNLMKSLHMLGIDANPAVLRLALTDVVEIPGVEITDPIMLLLPAINVIFSGIVKGEIQSETREDGSEKKGDLINTFGSAYNSIASLMAEVTEDAFESSVRENDKTYYSHVTPSYLGKLIKNLKNVMNDPKRFEEFMQTEYKQYEWFFKDGKWRSDWLEQLATSADMRKGLNHKVLLNSDKVEYGNWDDLDYTLVMLTEYWGDPEKSNSSVQWAWYHVPILSDSPSAEFIRFRKYTSGKIMGDNGEYLKYDDIILDKLTDLVNQEYDRIMLVRERDDVYQNGNPNVAPIANYDISRDTKGNLKNIGGAEFKFLPALNDLTTPSGESFLDGISRLKKGSGAELREFIRTGLRQIMDEGFEDTYRSWSKSGLLDELSNGKYKYLPFGEGQSATNSRTAKALNKVKDILGAQFWSPEMEELLREYNTNSPIYDRDADSLFGIMKEILSNKVDSGDIQASEAQSLSSRLVVKNNAKEALREYYWNSKLATSQIIEITTTDLAFYKNLEDFQKRYKEIHAPSLRMNTQATFKGERIGRDWERTIYLKDDEIKSSILEDVRTVLNSKTDLSDVDKRMILTKFEEVNVADAQAYRSLSSYRAILGMSGQWTEDMQEAYDHFKSGNWSIKDFNTIWQTKKPYVYTQVNNDSGISGHTGIKTPVQHKNSEFLLLAMHELISGPLGKSGKLIGINKFMEENNIDVIQFESTTKVGKQGVVDLNKATTEEETMNTLKAATGIGSATGENPNVVHKISYEDYGIQTPTPEHAIDAVQLVGTQIRKLIAADISDDAVLNINGKSLTKKEWVDLYNAINTENIIQSFKDVDAIFKDPKEVEKILQEEVRGNQRYGIDMIRACTLDENGNFNIPLFDPVQSQKVQTLLNSIIKSRVTKQKIRGGALIQVSDYGLTDELHIVFEGEGANKRIKYLECYMPAYSKKFYEPLMDPQTHQLDVSKLPDDLRKLIGYRVPTEDKYSMAPLYIKGFLPQQNGSAIMLPAEITTLSGSDFDVDKLYIMLPEFNIRNIYNVKEAWDNFYSSNLDIVNEIDKNLGEALTQFIKEQTEDWDEALDQDDIEDFTREFKEWLKKEGIKRYQFSETAQKKFSEWFKSNKKNYFVKRKIEKVKYDFNKSPEENGLEARNNLLIDMMYGVLTNPDTAPKVLNPGGFDYQKRAARITTILNSVSENALKEALEEVGIKFDKTIDVKGRKQPAPLVSYLLNIVDVNILDKIASKTKVPMDPLSPRTQVLLHQQNMTGAKLIAIYANHNANHALMQYTKLALDGDNGSFLLNGKRLTSLHEIKNANNEFISRNNAGYLAASVDNVKDPVLAALNQNTFTADASMLLSRLGYTPIEIGLLMTQPIVTDITQTYFRESREGKGKGTVIDSILAEYRKKAAITDDLTYDNYKSNTFSIEDLANNILLSKEMPEVPTRNTDNFDKISYYQKQVAVGYLFKRIMSSADALAKLVQATRADTPDGAAGPTIADTALKIEKVDDLLNEVENNLSFPLINADVILNSISYNGDINKTREELLKAPLPFLQAFYTLGLKETERMLKNYFPQFTTPFKDVIDHLRDMTKTGRLDVKTMNSIYNDLLAYIMSKTEFFGVENRKDSEGNSVTSSMEDKRRAFITNFPIYFKSMVSNNEDIAELEFIKRLKVIRANDNNPVDTVIFKNVGQLSPTLRERYMRDWASLLYMKNPEAQKLALNLFRYSYYRNGFAFGPNTFIHLAPVAVRTAIPEYISTLRSLLSSDEDDYSQFEEQYVYNHLDNRKLVPEIPEEASTSFVGDDNEIKDVVTFTIDESSTFGDKKVVKKQLMGDDGQPFYDFFKFIGKRYKGKYVYYRLDESVAATQENTAIYSRIEPLGYRNSFIEYEYGKDASEINTVIEKNQKDYDPYGDVLARFDTGDDNIDDDSAPSFEIPFKGIAEFLGLTPASTDSKDITSIPPNTDFTDEENKKPCSRAQTLYTL